MTIFNLPSLAEVTRIPKAIMERRIVKHALNTIRSGGVEALKQHLRHGHTLASMDDFARVANFTSTLTDLEKQRLASFDPLAINEMIARVAIENDADGNIVFVAVTENGRSQIGQALTVASAQWAVAQRLSHAVPLTVTAKDAYVLQCEAHGDVLLWTTLASTPEEAKRSKLNALDSDGIDPAKVKTIPMWDAVCHVVANTFDDSTESVGIVKEDAFHSQNIVLAESEHRHTFTLRRDDDLVGLLHSMFRFSLELAGFEIEEELAR